MAPFSGRLAVRMYYRGSAEEPLPVELTLSYFLDGSPISAQDLAGKSGAG